MKAAQEKLSACEFVKSGQLKAEPVREATAADPLWHLNLAYVDAERLLDRCTVSATTGEVVCRGDSCP
jgi:hypothetical protein